MWRTASTAAPASRWIVSTRLDGGVEAQEVGLLRDRGDQLDHVADLLAGAAEFRLSALSDAAFGTPRTMSNAYPVCQPFQSAAWYFTCNACWVSAELACTPVEAASWVPNPAYPTTASPATCASTSPKPAMSRTRTENVRMCVPPPKCLGWFQMTSVRGWGCRPGAGG